MPRSSSLPLAVLVSLLAASGCAPEPCTVADNGDGTFTLTCPDGTSASIGNGEDGASWLTATADEPAGANCPDGGQAITVGPDTNGDGELSSDEVVSTTYICDGADGADGITYVVDVQSEPAGETCPLGGVVITVGPDTNGNGVLDPDEVTATEYVCDGLNGPEGPAGADALATLVRVDEEPEGSNCAAGGLAVHTGVDDDDDGVLGDPEIDTTDYVCDGEDGADGSGGGAFATVAFPASDSVASNTFNRSTVGASVNMYNTGSYVEDSFTGTGVTEITGLSYAFIIDDNTTTACSVGTLTFDVDVNSTNVGSFSFKGSNGGKNLTITGSHTFTAVAGTGTNNDEYEIRFEATNRVCSGAGTYVVRPGGQFFLIP